MVTPLQPLASDLTLEWEEVVEEEPEEQALAALEVVDFGRELLREASWDTC